MKEIIDYQPILIKKGIELHLLPTKKFKTTLMKVVIQEQLQQETAPMVALLSYILFRGTRTRVTTIEMMRYLEGLYGANFSSDVDKYGECQYLTFTLEVINQHYLPGGENLLTEGLNFLMEVLTDPLTDNGAFKPEYFHQEKAALKDDIESLFNDKTKYAYERCRQIMCEDEPYGIYKYGQIKELAKIKNQQLYQYYQSLLQNNPIHLYLVGDLKKDDLLPKIQAAFQDFAPRNASFPPVIFDKEEVIPKTVIEEENVRQGKLSMGYRTKITRRSNLYPALVVFNGIFGGLPHSKLFQNVREKASLAYYIYSGIDSTKGILQIDCGIESSALDQVLQIVEKDLADISHGKITKAELDFTKKAYARYFRYITDDNQLLIDSCMLDIANNKRPLRDLIDRLAAVTIADIQRVANRIELDTIYFLKSREAVRDETNDNARKNL